MRVVVTGGTGFLGTHLGAAMRDGGDEVVVVSRTPGAGTIGWDDLPAAVDGAGAVINLAGATIARRWSEAGKRAIRESRLASTRRVVEAVRKAKQRPAVVVSQSAVGAYGPRGDEEIGEDAPPGDDFLARVCLAWETEAAPIAALGVRLAILRTGVVLARDGGALARMWTPFSLGLGGPVGAGTQPFPWIHIGDWVALCRFAILTGGATGPLNATAPGIVTSREFAKALGRALGRPAVLPLPAAALRLALGEMAQMLLTGQRAAPRRATALGFRFAYPAIDAALAQIASRASRRMPG